MKLAEALKRIEELERRVKELEAQPRQEFHYHYHYHYSQPANYAPWHPCLPWVGDSPAISISPQYLQGASLTADSRG